MAASVTNDLDSFKKGLTAVAERLGCPTCFSGADCTFQQERDFIVDESLKVTPRAELGGATTSFEPGRGGTGVTVRLTPEAEYDLDHILRAVDIIGRDLGQHWKSGGLAYCCSGFDITFQQQLSFLVDGEGSVRPG